MKTHFTPSIFGIVLVATLLMVGMFHFVLGADSASSVMSDDDCWSSACLTFVMFVSTFVFYPIRLNGKVYPSTLPGPMTDLPHLDPPPRFLLVMAA